MADNALLQYPLRLTNARHEYKISSTVMSVTSHEMLMNFVLKGFTAAVADTETFTKFSSATRTASGIQIPTVISAFEFKYAPLPPASNTLTQAIAQYMLLSLTCFVVDLEATPGESTALQEDCQNKLNTAHTFLFTPHKLSQTPVSKDKIILSFEAIVEALRGMMPGLDISLQQKPTLAIVVETISVSVDNFGCFETIAIFAASLVAAAFQTYKKAGTDLLKTMHEVVKAIVEQAKIRTRVTNTSSAARRSKPKIYILTSWMQLTSTSKADFDTILYPEDGAVSSIETATLLDRVAQILNESMANKNRRTLIICTSRGFNTSSTKTMDVSGVINDALSTFMSSTKESLKNLSVIHETQDLAHVIYSIGVGAKSRVRSIHNIFFRPDDESIALGSYFAGLDLLSRSTSITLSFNRSNTLELKNGHTVSFRFMPIPDPKKASTVLEEQWWFHAIVNIPTCADGRMTQLSGSCWWNALMNALLLTEGTATLMRASWNRVSEEDRKAWENTTLDNCPMMSMKLPQFLHILINQILIKGNRAANWQGDFISYGALLTYNAISNQHAADDRGRDVYFKRIAEYLKTTKNKAYNMYRDGGRSEQAIVPIAALLFIKGVEYNIIDMPQPWQMSKKASLMASSPTFRWNSADESDADKTWKDHPHPPVVFILDAAGQGGNKPCQEVIFVNDSEYSLVSAVLDVVVRKTGVGAGHVIAGLTCQNDGKMERYTYDSNNRITMDDWTKGHAPFFTDAALKSKEAGSGLKGILVYVFTLNTLNSPP